MGTLTIHGQKVEVKKVQVKPETMMMSGVMHGMPGGRGGGSGFYG